MSSVFKNQSFSPSVARVEFTKKGLPRAVESVLAVGGLIAVMPLLAICALLVWASSPGPIFFRQSRVGRYGETFTLYKFRTMLISVKGLPITAASDSRITPIGRFLRKWKLDELPEIYNVLRGDMSFVGPRPEVPELVDFSNPAWKRILKARPGITDPVTLRLRNEEAVLATVEDKEAYYREIVQPFKIKGYLKYLESKSLKTDLKIVANTAKVILIPRTAPPHIEEIHLSFIK